jgi:virginiamycin B lyase
MLCTGMTRRTTQMIRPAWLAGALTTLLLASLFAPPPAQGQTPADSEAEPIPDLPTNVRIDTPPLAASNTPVDITEWTVPWPDTRPRDPDVAPNGTIWFVGQAGDYVGFFDPETAEFSRQELPPGTGPHNVIVDRDAMLWVAGNRQGYIGKMDPNSGRLFRYPMPLEEVRDPHTLVFTGKGEIWFSAQWANYVGRLDQRTGAVELIEVPVDQSRPYGVKLDSRGRPWFALLGTNALATVDPESLQLEVVRTPQEESRLRRVAITSDDRIWYTDYNGGWLGVYDPKAGNFHEWKLPSERSGPYAIAADGKDRIWLVETWPEKNVFLGFDPERGEFFSHTVIPSGAGAVRHMVYDVERNAIWFGTDTNKLARARLPR